MARYLVFDLSHGVDAPAIREALTRLTPLVDGSDVVVGIGPSLVQALGAELPGVHEYPDFSRGSLQVPVTPGTLWCWLRGSEAVMKACQHAADGETFSVQEVECLGGCVNAPVVQINDDFYEDLDEASITKVLDAFRRGETPKPGPQVDRQTSAPEGGPTTLKGE